MDKGYPPNSGYPPQPQYGQYPPQNSQYGQQPYPPQQPQYGQQQYPPQSQQYGQQQYPPQQPQYGHQQYQNADVHSSYVPPVYNDQPNASFLPTADTGEKFKEKSQFNDIWAAILFIVHLAGFIVLSVMMIKKVDFASFKVGGGKSSSSKPEGPFLSNSNSLISLVAAAIISGVLSLLYIILMQIAARILIIISFWFSVLMYFALAAFCFIKQQYIPAVLTLVFACIYVYCWFSWKERIPLATLMLVNVAKFTKRYPGTIFVGFIFMVLSLAYTFLWVLTVVCANSVYSDDVTTNSKGRKSASGALYGILAFSAFSLFWVCQLLKDLCHMTVSGAFAADYFFPSTTSAASRFTSFSSLGRALTTSFGSACFGSLIVAILQLLKALANEARHNSDNFVLAFLACCAECILAQIEAMVEYFNRYAYCYCAMYGLPYIEAGKSTWTLIKDRGVDAIVNDSLIGNVLLLGSVLISVLSGGAAALAEFALNGTSNSVSLFLVALIGFFIGLLVNSVVSSVIESANNAFFVCLAEDPQALASYNPELYEKIRQTYPDVANPV